MDIFGGSIEIEYFLVFNVRKRVIFQQFQIFFEGGYA